MRARRKERGRKRREEERKEKGEWTGEMREREEKGEKKKKEEIRDSCLCDPHRRQKLCVHSIQDQGPSEQVQILAPNHSLRPTDLFKGKKHTHKHQA